MNPHCTEYKNYGGRGIKVCDRWLRFEAFLSDMGSTFDGEAELDRKDNGGNYEPGNCRWVNRVTQQRNKRTNHLVTIDGVRKPLVEWAEATGLKANTILTRIRRGWPEERLLDSVKGSANA